MLGRELIEKIRDLIELNGHDSDVVISIEGRHIPIKMECIYISSFDNIAIIPTLY